MPTFSIYQQGDPSVGIWEVNEHNLSLGQVLRHLLPYHVDEPNNNQFTEEDQNYFLEAVDRINTLEIGQVALEDDCFQITRLT